jgi:HSP20 family protein
MLPVVFGENMLDDFFGDSFEKRFFGDHSPLYGKHAKNLMRTDIRELADHYEVNVDLPGFKKDEVNLTVKDGYLTITAAKGLDKDEKDQEGRYIRRERYSGACSRSFYVGDVKPETVHAKYENGILTVSVPKAEAKNAEGAKRIAIE